MSGIFIVKSAYKLARTIKQPPREEAESSRAGGDRTKMWERVWKLPIKPKLRHFLWKCLHNWLGTGVAVRGRGMIVDDVCKRCREGKETREHLFFYCHESALIWNYLQYAGKEFMA